MWNEKQFNESEMCNQEGEMLHIKGWDKIRYQMSVKTTKSIEHRG